MYKNIGIAIKINMKRIKIKTTLPFDFKDKTFSLNKKQKKSIAPILRLTKNNKTTSSFWSKRKYITKQMIQKKNKEKRDQKKLLSIFK